MRLRATRAGSHARLFVQGIPPMSQSLAAQLFRATSPLAEGRQLTDGIDPVPRATYEPRTGR
ncbi:hypothetical protein ACG04R_03915 [Roseateles sp. BYS78W]|uniref:Uncharacterized protein n=1 Tax=Pelomonas candidula TaxID=3299025 RepID=A0ABW7H7C8_9BURK